MVLIILAMMTPVITVKGTVLLMVGKSLGWLFVTPAKAQGLILGEPTD